MGTVRKYVKCDDPHSIHISVSLILYIYKTIISPFRNFCTTVQKFTYDLRPVHIDNDETVTDPQTPIPLES